MLATLKKTADYKQSKLPLRTNLGGLHGLFDSDNTFSNLLYISVDRMRQGATKICDPTFVIADVKANKIYERIILQ
jgi:hypothetical protein